MKYLWMILFLVGCSKTVEPIAPPVEEHEPEVVTEWVCEDDNGETLTCESHDDCCDGFHCIIDRSVSRSTKFCAWAGESAGIGQRVKSEKSAGLFLKKKKRKVSLID